MLGRPILVVTLGGALLAGVVGWRLTRPSYRADVQTICEAESRSGRDLRTDMAAVSDWVRSKLATPEGNELYSSLGDVPVADRVELLRARAATSNVWPCPVADAYQSLVRDGEYRSEVQHLCSKIEFTGLRELPAAARLDALEQWLETGARTARAGAVARALREASAPREQARVLREAAADAGVVSCDVARDLESPEPDAGANGGDDGGEPDGAPPSLTGPVTSQ